MPDRRDTYINGLYHLQALHTCPYTGGYRYHQAFIGHAWIGRCLDVAEQHQCVVSTQVMSLQGKFGSGCCNDHLRRHTINHWLVKWQHVELALQDRRRLHRGIIALDQHNAALVGNGEGIGRLEEDRPELR